MTKLEELEAAWDASVALDAAATAFNAAFDAVADADYVDALVAWDASLDAACDAARDVFNAELKKQKELNQ